MPSKSTDQTHITPSEDWETILSKIYDKKSEIYSVWMKHPEIDDPNHPKIRALKIPLEAELNKLERDLHIVMAHSDNAEERMECLRGLCPYSDGDFNFHASIMPIDKHHPSGTQEALKKWAEDLVF